MPPFIVSTNLETGASGTTSKVLRMPPPLPVSTLPARSTSIWPSRAATRSGSLWARSAGRPGLRAGVSSSGVIARCVAVDARRRALLAVAGAGGELHPGADGADVGLVEELGVGQGHLGRGDVGVVALGVGELRRQGRVAGALGRALEADRQLRGLKASLAQSPTWKGLVRAAVLAEDRSSSEPVTAIRSQLVGFRVNWLRVEADGDRADVERDALRLIVGIGSLSA